jgi:hypothetical protein
MSENMDMLAALEADILADSPIAPTLRRVILLGGRAGSSELRDWASRELNGYDDETSLPAYRRVPSPICIDANVGYTRRTGQVISPSILPEYAQELFAGGPAFFQGIGTIEAIAREAREDGGTVKMTHRNAMDLCAVLDDGQPFQETTALYWQVSAASIGGIVEHVKTTLAELVAAMRSRTPVGEILPAPAVATEAVRDILGGAGRNSKT